jgi:hypothetical protein
VDNVEPAKIWIFRKGSGQLRVHPSPVVIGKGATVTIYNLTGQDATAVFPDRTIVDSNNKPEITIRANACTEGLTVLAPSKSYFEYEVKAGGNYADGGSKPGGWVDP